MEPTLLGIGKTQWDLYNSFSNWLSALATLAAVFVSLYLARQTGRPRAKVTVGHRLVFTVGDRVKPAEVVFFRIVNTGNCVIRVTSIGWSAGIWTKRQAVQLFDATQSSSMPVELSHGQEASWIIPIDLEDRPWRTYFPSRMLHPYFLLSCWTLRGQFHTSIGKVFSARPDNSLLSVFQASLPDTNNKQP